MALSPIWTIELCERPVKKARNVDYVLFGRPLSHPFLVLLDDDGDVRGELHLAPFDVNHPDHRSRLNRLFELSTAITSPMGVDKIVRGLILHSHWRNHYPTLHSRFHDKAVQYGAATDRQMVASGNKIRLEAAWDALKQAAREQDILNLPYDRFGWGRGRNNCQTGLVQIMQKAGIGIVPLSGRYAAPGWHP